MIVLVKFPGSGKRYAYAAPDTMNLHKGDRVQVPTGYPSDDLSNEATVTKVNPRHVPYKHALSSVTRCIHRA